MTTYSNPRREAVIEDWPSGNRRVTARFWVESNGRGERVGRVTTGKPKYSTYAHRCVIVDGDDGKTYYIKATGSGFFSAVKGDMKYQHESVFPGDDRYREISALFSDL